VIKTGGEGLTVVLRVRLAAWWFVVCVEFLSLQIERLLSPNRVTSPAVMAEDLSINRFTDEGIWLRNYTLTRLGY